MTAGSAAAGPHLFLVGMMGSGKSTVGRLCAAALDRPFVDLDAEVERLGGRSVADLFAAEGEDGFRRRESEALAGVAASGVPSVVACGGGVVLDAPNRGRLRSAGVVVWLDAPPPALAARLGRGEGRPLLGAAPGGVEAELARIAALRSPAYRDSAHVVVDAAPDDPAVVAAAVLDAYRAHRAAPGSTEPVRP